MTTKNYIINKNKIGQMSYQLSRRRIITWEGLSQSVIKRGEGWSATSHLQATTNRPYYIFIPKIQNFHTHDKKV